MNPVAFNFFGIEIRYYSIFILCGIIISYFFISREAAKFKIDKDVIFNLFFWSLIIGIICARLYYVFFSWNYFRDHLNEIWQIYKGGLAIHGGLFGGLLTFAIYTRKHNIRFLRTTDMVAPYIMLSQAIGRWGNFFNSEAYGIPTTYEHLKSLHIPKFVIDGMYINNTYYTPTFFYESIICLLGFILLIIFKKRKLTKVGQVTALYLIIYGTVRFFIEHLRTDSLIFMNFKVAQLVSILMVIGGIVLFIRTKQKNKFQDLYNNEKNI